jgi:hypothetical protein
MDVFGSAAEAVDKDVASEETLSDDHESEE